MRALLVLNDPPYGTERSYNGLRLVGALARHDDCEVRVFLMGDAVGCAAANQKVPDGYYHLDRMIGSAARHGAEVGCCGTCLDARGIDDDHLAKGAHRSHSTSSSSGPAGPTGPSPSEVTAPPMATGRGTATGWQGDAVAYDRWFDVRWGRHAFGVEARALLDAAPELDGARVLDAGCGTGRFATVLAGAGATVVGVDPDAGMLGVATGRLRGRCGQGVAEELPIPGGVVDVAVAVTVLEFVADPAAAMAELARVTRPGGRILVGALNPRSPWGWAHRRLLRSGVWCHARFLDRGQLVALGTPYGSTRLYPALYAPGWFPGLAAVGPLAEMLGRLAPGSGAFQVLAVDKPTEP